MNTAVEMQGITKHFGNVTANDSVDLEVEKGEIQALVGENGAGKSTLMNILYGLYQPDKGTILINGREKTIGSPSTAISSGIGMVHQHFMLVGTLSVLENIILGDEDVYPGGILNLKTAIKKLDDLIKKFNLNIDLSSKVETLPVGIQQKIEILKVLYRKSDIFIFDEPTAVLTPHETVEFFELLKNLKQNGNTIILITHKLGEVISVSDRVTVLRLGRVTGKKITAETNHNELAEIIVGGSVPPAEKKLKLKETQAILSVKELEVESDRKITSVNKISFEIKAGEIFGIAGVEGNGQTELVEAINGLRAVKSGEILISAASPVVNEKEQGGKITISHIPAERHKHGLVNEYNLYENVLLGRQYEERFSSKIFIKEKELIDYTKNLVKDYDIRPGNVMQIAGNLSGGNQQKLVASRELSKDSNLIIASHPTRGLDINAATFVLNELVKHRNQGKAVLFVSSDISELLNVADRIGVMYEGKITALLNPAETTEKDIGMYMTGAK